MPIHARSEREIHPEHRSVLATLTLNIGGESMPVAEKSIHFEPPHWQSSVGFNRLAEVCDGCILNVFEVQGEGRSG